jgi:hypothetical protein
MRAFVERHFAIFDLTAALVLSAGLFLWGHVVDHDAKLLALLSGNRTAIYGVIAGLFATVFGFALTAMSIVLAFAESPRLQILRSSRHWATLWSVFLRGLRIYILAALAAVVGMLLDRDRAPSALMSYAVMAVALVGTAQLYRTLWAFENLIRVMTRPTPQSGKPSRDAVPELVGRH